jgi:hypothetical protein
MKRCAFPPEMKSHSSDHKCPTAGSMGGQENGAARVSKRAFEIYSMQMLKYKTLHARLLTRAPLFRSSCRWHHDLSNWIRNRKTMRHLAGRLRSQGPIVGQSVMVGPIHLQAARACSGAF